MSKIKAVEHSTELSQVSNPDAAVEAVPAQVPLTNKPTDQERLVELRKRMSAHTGSRTFTEKHEEVWLPSGFATYPYKSIGVRRLSIAEIRALARARVTGNLCHNIRAFDATLTEPAHTLTIGDYWYIMYWHRINSYKRTPFFLTATCSNPDHVTKVKNGELDADTLKITHTVGKSDLNTVELDVSKVEGITKEILDTFNVHVAPHRLLDMVYALELSDELDMERRRKGADVEAVKKLDLQQAINDADVDEFIRIQEGLELLAEDEERSFMERYAAVISEKHGVSLSERIAFLDEQEPDLLTYLDKYIEACDHGVRESWTLTCKECSASKTIEQSLDALTFLPSV